jgi:hypothetical protein
LAEYRICRKCVCDTSDVFLRFDDKGICSHCRMHDEMDRRYPIDEKGYLDRLVKDIKLSSKNNNYGCIVGISGGRDSTYTLYLAKKLGLKPIALHIDNGWVNPVAAENIKRTMSLLKTELISVRYDRRKLMKSYLAFLKASTPDFCVPCNLGVYGSLYHEASKRDIKYILSGYSFRTEGVMPLSWTYWDGTYYESVTKRFSD